jgi:hypothetical protein
LGGELFDNQKRILYTYIVNNCMTNQYLITQFSCHRIGVRNPRIIGG